MSWAGEEWKDGLPHKALRKIEELESSASQLRKEKQQRLLHIERLDAAFTKQKQLVDEERGSSAALKRDLQSLSNVNCELERKAQKLHVDVQAKENRLLCAESQVDRLKKSLEKEQASNSRLTKELERCSQQGDESSRQLDALRNDLRKREQQQRNNGRDQEDAGRQLAGKSNLSFSPKSSSFFSECVNLSFMLSWVVSLCYSIRLSYLVFFRGESKLQLVAASFRCFFYCICGSVSRLACVRGRVLIFVELFGG